MKPKERGKTEWCEWVCIKSSPTSQNVSNEEHHHQCNGGRTVARQGRRWRWRKKNVDGDEKEDDGRGVPERKKE